MKTAIRALVTAVLMTAGGMTLAHEYKAGDIEVMHPWTRATPPNAETAGGFLKLQNTGSTADSLIGAHSPIAERVEVHTMSVENGVMRMRPVGADGVPVMPGETVALEPGGMHVMFMGIKHPLKEGERVPLTLVFRNGGSVDVELVTQPLGSRHEEGMDGMKGMEQSHQ